MNSRPIKCLIVDDEKLARTLLQNYIAKLPGLELAGSCKNPFEATAILQQEPIDLVFLDIQMPELTGIEFLKTLPARPLVIFTTAYQDYALEGYQLDIVDYLVKPFRFDRFLQAVNKATRRLQAETLLQQPTVQPATPKSFERSFLLINSNHTTHKVFLDEISYIEGMKEYVSFHLPDRRIISLQSLKQLEEELPEEQFIRVHKSYIVAKKKVTALTGTTLYLGKEKIPVGSSYKAQVQAFFFDQGNG
ncbi:MAG: response regulator transcription factor [Lewinella sp.]|nr:response regulator transcription factor [Lewinella sp.]